MRGTRAAAPFLVRQPSAAIVQIHTLLFLAPGLTGSGGIVNRSFASRLLAVLSQGEGSVRQKELEASGSLFFFLRLA